MSAPRRELTRPLVLGLSVGHPLGSVGSIGPFVRNDVGQVGFLCLAFAIAPPGAKLGDYIHQPGRIDTEILTGETRVARLGKVAAARDRASSDTDCAFALLEPSIEFEGNIAPSSTLYGYRKISSIVGLDALHVGDEVAFIGRTSGFVEGRVTNPHLVDLDVNDATGRFRFNSAIEVAGIARQFCQPGDGGSLVWRRSDMAAVGMVFAGAGPEDDVNVGYVLPITEALNSVGAVLA